MFSVFMRRPWVAGIAVNGGYTRYTKFPFSPRLSWPAELNLLGLVRLAFGGFLLHPLVYIGI